MRVERLTGTALEGALDGVARLRIAVFRDWPYLYDGDLTYERRYLDAYRNSPRAVVVGAFDGERIVGRKVSPAWAANATTTGAASLAPADAFMALMDGRTILDLAEGRLYHDRELNERFTTVLT